MFTVESAESICSFFDSIALFIFQDSLSIHTFQMVVVNLFALSYFLGKINIKTGEEAGGNKDEEKRENIKG